MLRWRWRLPPQAVFDKSVPSDEDGLPAMRAWEKATGAAVYGMPTCYRCPSGHVDLVNHVMHPFQVAAAAQQLHRWPARLPPAAAGVVHAANLHTSKRLRVHVQPVCMRPVASTPTCACLHAVQERYEGVRLKAHKGHLPHSEPFVFLQVRAAAGSPAVLGSSCIAVSALLAQPAACNPAET
jgi:hypothetical protein